MGGWELKKILGGVTIIVFFLSAIHVYSHTEKHADKHGEAGREQHDEMREGHETMKVLHSSMAELNVQANKVFHAIIHSQFSELGGSVDAIKKIADNLEGTRPHKNLKNLDKYRNLIKTLKIECLAFENAVVNQDPLKIPDKFGGVLGVCVECHVHFRD